MDGMSGLDKNQTRQDLAVYVKGAEEILKKEHEKTMK